MSERAVRPRNSRFNTLLRITGHLPYGLVTRCIAACGAFAPLRRALLGRRAGLIRKLMPVLAPAADATALERICFSASLWVPWRANALSRCSDATFDHWVKITGLEHIEQAQAGGKGIVLVGCHLCVSRLVPLVLLRKGYIVNALEPEPWLLRMGVKGAEAIPVIDLRAGDQFWLKELFKAKRVLDEGRILHLAADGLQGRQGVKARFLGKEREFHASFAELAVKTAATVIPVVGTVDALGVITITIGPALQASDDSASHQDRVRELLNQYIAQLELRWKSDFGNVVPMHMRHYAELPMAADVVDKVSDVQQVAADA